MVARINTPHRLHDAMNYNENKIKKGTAECIFAGNYILNAADMNFTQKMAGLEKRNTLNDRASTKTLHISLNFHPSEKLNKDKLIDIATLYMNRLGFSEQPYLLYQHSDAGHPHIHIIATTIRADGSRINTHNIGRNQSEVARKEVEKTFKLIKADKKHLTTTQILPITPEKITYGKVETKKAIANVVSKIYSQYKFTSLPEFNAALRQFNVVADRGDEKGRVFKSGGLYYRILDESGHKSGVPIKASSLQLSPTLKNLQEKFENNKAARENFKDATRLSINKVLHQNPGSFKEFSEQLKKEGIFILERRSSNGDVFGLTYVDNISKTVFNGSDLGKQYSAKATIARISSGQAKAETNNKVPEPVSETKQVGNSKNILSEQDQEQEKNIGLIDTLLYAGSHSGAVPFQLKKKTKKKKRKNNS